LSPLLFLLSSIFRAFSLSGPRSWPCLFDWTESSQRRAHMTDSSIGGQIADPESFFCFARPASFLFILWPLLRCRVRQYQRRLFKCFVGVRLTP
jgi:hypothetical protein